MRAFSPDRLAMLLMFPVAMFADDAEMATVNRPTTVEIGDSLFRQSRFEEADRAYREVLAVDANHPKAYLGLGRIALVSNRKEEARQQFARAFQLAPQDPDILYSHAMHRTNATERASLLRAYMQNSGNASRERREDALAKLRILERVGDRELWKLTSPYRPYHLRLKDFAPNGLSSSGKLVEIRVNDGKPLRLLLDSGADGIFVHASRLRQTELEWLAETASAGLGSGQPANGRIGLAQSVTAGELRLENCLIQVMNRDLIPGADGVIGSAIFEAFLLRLDSARETLDLLPYPDAVQAGAIPFYRIGQLILVRAGISKTKDGYFVLDTGAARSCLSWDKAGPRQGTIRMQGANRDSVTSFRIAPIQLQLGERKLVDEDPIGMDLREAEQREGVAIDGIAGFSLFRHAVLTINYRDGLLAIETARR